MDDSKSDFFVFLLESQNCFRFVLASDTYNSVTARHEIFHDRIGCVRVELPRDLAGVRRTKANNDAAQNASFGCSVGCRDYCRLCSGVLGPPLRLSLTWLETST